MINAKSRLLMVLAMACVLVAPAKLESQCATSITNSFSSGSFMEVTKMIAPAASCTTVAPMVAFYCQVFPGMTLATRLIASAFTGTASPQCNWVCNCPGSPMQMVSIDGSDGLPVELMDFSIDDEPAEAEDEQAAGED